MLALRFLLHTIEPGVVIKKLVEMGERDLTHHNQLVVGDVRRRILKTVLELNLHPPAELVDVEGGA